MEFVFSSILSSTDDSCFTLDETWETLESQDLQVKTDMVLLYSESSGMPWEGL